MKPPYGACLAPLRLRRGETVMRRTDRLLDLIQILRDGQLHRAEDIAHRLEVSLRTIYRDMETLQVSGIPVEGTRGAGYKLTAPITLPPLNLTLIEFEALELAMAVVTEAADPELQEAARSLSAKIDAVVPADKSQPQSGAGFAVHPFAGTARGFRHMPTLRSAIHARQKLEIGQRGADGSETCSIIRPLRMDYWGRVWSVIAWCEQREDFWELRLDRITWVTVLPELFVDEPGRTLADYLDRRRDGG